MNYLIFFPLFLLTSCSSLVKSHNVNYEIESHFHEVKKLLLDGNQSYLESYLNSNLQNIHSHFYDDLAFNSLLDPDWKKHKKAKIKGLLADFAKNEQKILRTHNQIMLNAKINIEDTINAIPFDRNIKLIVTPIFTSGGTVRVREKEILAGVGSNIISKFSSSNLMNGIISHELTHASHIIHSDFPGADELDEWKTTGKLYWGLWSEGLASYGVFSILKVKTLDHVFGYDEYSTINTSFVSETDKKLAKKFLKIMDEKYIDFSNKGTMIRLKNWFGVESDVLGRNTPRSPGYYLGFRIVKLIIDSEDYRFNELLSLNKSKARMLIRKTLLRMLES